MLALGLALAALASGFELPYLASDLGYLASRCTPLEEIDPRGMSGGRSVVDFETDPELAYLQSEAQAPCE